MTSGSSDQPPFEPHAAASERPPGEAEAEHRPADRHERYGPLSLLRTRKADGRALLLFSHSDEGQER